ncbi:MAG: hypothetical protein ABIW48_01015 [Burkholderiales bacterium]
MSTKFIVSSITGLGLIALSTLGNAANNNPLSPGFQRHKVTITAPASADATRYVDSANPLTPVFTRSGKGKWVTTTLRTNRLYRDTANPLHPGFKRI